MLFRRPWTTYCNECDRLVKGRPMSHLRDVHPGEFYEIEANPTTRVARIGERVA